MNKSNKESLSIECIIVIPWTIKLNNFISPISPKSKMKFLSRRINQSFKMHKTHKFQVEAYLVGNDTIRAK